MSKWIVTLLGKEIRKSSNIYSNDKELNIWSTIVEFNGDLPSEKEINTLRVPYKDSMFGIEYKYDIVMMQKLAEKEVEK